MAIQKGDLEAVRPVRLLVSIADACEMIGVKRTSMYEFIRAGKIRVVKIGSRGVRVPVSELERFVAEGLS
jgi:excisionase family DNA binding protein